MWACCCVYLKLCLVLGMNVLRKIIILLLGMEMFITYMPGNQITRILFFLGPLLAILYIIIQTAYKYILNMDVQIMNLPQKIGLVAYYLTIIIFIQLMHGNGMGFEGFDRLLLLGIPLSVGHLTMFIGFIIMKPGD